MKTNLLLKGYEVELFTGSSSGEHVGISADLIDEMPEFVKEPDLRNIEYITSPDNQYLGLKHKLLTPRRKLREWLSNKNLTIIPGSTMSLGNSKIFQRSDPLNSYHDFIEANYGTKVVTTSIHINLGVENLDDLFSSLRLVRCEAALLLALSASSPFLDGISTTAHSHRWLQFPLTPSKVPIFLNHSHYVSWIEENLKSGVMVNERHLWTSVRPNGPHRPYKLNRLELRICDLITNCDLLLACTALIELRLINLFRSPKQLDPMEASHLSLDELALLSDMNDQAAAKNSLNATLHHWRDGKPILCREWINQLIQEMLPLAKEFDMPHILSPIQSILLDGNQAMQWLDSYEKGQSVQAIIQKSIAEMQAEEFSVGHPEVILE